MSLASVISNQNISNSLLEPKSSLGQTDGKSARSPAVRQETGLLPDQTKKWVTIIPLIAETVWRREESFSRGRCYFPLMRISYEDAEEKQRWLQGGTVVSLFTCRIQLVEPIYVNIGARKNSTVILGTLGEGQRKVQSAVRKTSWRFLVARADVRSGVQTRWLRFSLIVNHILPSSQMFLCLKWCQGLLNEKAFIHERQTIGAKSAKMLNLQGYFTAPLRKINEEFVSKTVCIDVKQLIMS